MPLEEGSFGNKQASLGSTSGRFLLPELPAPWGIILHIRTQKGYILGTRAMCNNNAQLSTGPEFPLNIIPDSYQCLFFSGQISPFFDKEIGKFLDLLFLVQIQVTFVLCRKKNPIFYGKNKKKKY
jgi:hypothetical protein